MRARIEAYDALAVLLSYPKSEFQAFLARTIETVSAALPQAREELEKFKEAVTTMSVEELEELYTRTFDNNTKRCLEIGWHLFGENYTRGAFLVHMRSELRRLSVAESAELPDHLTHVMQVIGRLDPEPAAVFAEDSVLPAIDKILPSLFNDKNISVHVLQATELACRDLVSGQKEGALQECRDE